MLNQTAAVAFVYKCSSL